MTISGYLYRVPSLRVQLEAGVSKLLLFEPFSYNFFFPTQVMEELALQKMQFLAGFFIITEGFRVVVTRSLLMVKASDGIIKKEYN